MTFHCPTPRLSLSLCCQCHTHAPISLKPHITCRHRTWNFEKFKVWDCPTLRINLAKIRGPTLRKSSKSFYLSPQIKLAGLGLSSSMLKLCVTTPWATMAEQHREDNARTKQWCEANCSRFFSPASETDRQTDRDPRRTYGPNWGPNLVWHTNTSPPNLCTHFYRVKVQS